MSRRPNLFIIGAPKSGTTSLYDYLDGHPDVFMSAIKEPIYFAPDMQAGFKHRFTFGDDETEYLALYDNARDERYAGEASTRYLASHSAPKLIHDFDPEARIVAMLRNPVEMIYALHNERVSQLSEDVVDFTEALKLDDERRAGRHLPRGSNPMGSAYRDNAKFGEQIERWFAQFKRENVHIIIFDDFAKDTPGAFRKLLEFLAIDPDYRPAEFAIVNKSHRSRGGAARALMTSGASHWTRHTLLPRVVGEDRSARMARSLRQSRLNRRPNPRPPLPPELLQTLQQEFTPDVELLSRLIGRDMIAAWFPATK